MEELVFGPSPRTRRSFLAAVASATTGISGCTTDRRDPDSIRASWTEPGGAPSRSIEVAHPWTDPATRAGMSALRDGFREFQMEVAGEDGGVGIEESVVEIEETIVDGDRGTLPKSEIRERIVDGRPPEVFAIRAGPSLVPYRTVDAIRSLDRLFDEDLSGSNRVQNGSYRDLKGIYRESALEAVRIEGETVAIPVSMHRTDLFYCNSSVCDASGIDPSEIRTPVAFLDLLDRIETETGVAAFVQVDAPWAIGQLWETILFGIDVEAYEAVGTGSLGEHRDAVRSSLRTLAAVLDRAAEVPTWIEAADAVAAGNAGCCQQGSWLAGHLLTIDQLHTTDNLTTSGNREVIRQLAFTNSDDRFLATIDAFVASRASDEPLAAERFLAYVITADAQSRFVAATGAIPTRNDVVIERRAERSDPTPDAEPERLIADTAGAEAIPSIAHGLAVDPNDRWALLSAVDRFASSRVHSTASLERALEEIEAAIT